MSLVREGQHCEPCMFVGLDSVRAEKICEECLERYCEPCALHHAKFRVFRNHHVVDIQPCLDYENVQTREPETVNVTPTDDISSLETDSDYIDMEFPSTKQRDTTDGDSYVDFDTDRRQPTKPVEDIANFDVIVHKTDFVRCIPGINHTDLPGTHFRFVVCKSGFRLLLGQKTVFRAGINVMRRFGIKDNLVSIHFGRSCEFGEGKLCLKSADASDIAKCIRTNMSKICKNVD